MHDARSRCMRSPVLRHRILVSYVPLQTESSANVLRWYSCIGTIFVKGFLFRNYPDDITNAKSLACKGDDFAECIECAKHMI